MERKENHPDEVEELRKQLEVEKANAEGLEKALESERTRVAEYTGLLQRLQADFENHVKRSDAERAARARDLAEGLTLKLLEVSDTMDLALAGKPDPGCERMFDGFRRVGAKLKEVLVGEGVEEVPTDGAFNRDVHEAVDVALDAGRPDGTIVDVVQRGYRLNGRLIRTSKVVGAKNEVK